MKLSEQIEAIAKGLKFDAIALHQARSHEIATYNDRAMISRFLYGLELSGDKERLMQFAGYLSEFESKE